MGAIPYRLGRLPHDPAVVAALPVHRFGAAPPPAVMDRSKVSYVPQLYQNDVYPDCTAVGLANAARGIAALNHVPLGVAPIAVPEFYAGSIGIADTPQAIEASDGAVLADVLAYQAAHGFNTGMDVLKAKFGRVNLSVTDLAHSIGRFGVGYWGVTLRDRDMQTVGQTWDVQDGRDDGPVVGGHCVIAFDYTGLADEATVRIGTWGQWQPATWGWVKARLDEAYGLVWPQLARHDGTNFCNMTCDIMLRELGAA